MYNDAKLINKVTSLPDDLKKDVNDFIDFLESRRMEKSTSQKRISGLAKGLIRMKEDFDEPLDEFKD